MKTPHRQALGQPAGLNPDPTCYEVTMLTTSPACCPGYFCSINVPVLCNFVNSTGYKVHYCLLLSVVDSIAVNVSSLKKKILGLLYNNLTAVT